MICKNCEKEFFEKYSKWSNGDFCSKSCAKTRKHTLEQNLKVSHKMLGHHYNKGQIPWNKGIKVGSRSNNYRCGRKIDLKEILEGKQPQYVTTTLRDRLFLEGIFEDKCCKCGWSQKRKYYKFSTCHLHHKNGIDNDHKLENLEILCPNCHSLTDSYCKRKDSIGKPPNRTYDNRNKVIHLNK